MQGNTDKVHNTRQTWHMTWTNKKNNSEIHRRNEYKWSEEFMGWEEDEIAWDTSAVIWSKEVQKFDYITRKKIQVQELSVQDKSCTIHWQMDLRTNIAILQQRVSQMESFLRFGITQHLTRDKHVENQFKRLILKFYILNDETHNIYQICNLKFFPQRTRWQSQNLNFIDLLTYDWQIHRKR